MSEHGPAEAAIRLNKFLAHAGFGSRRRVEELILGGRVSLDGETVRELGSRIQPEQKVRVDGELVKQEKLVYWMVNKPRGVLCTNFDPHGRRRVIDLVPHISQRVYTVGRLDEASEGLILLTNDGDLAHRLMHPRFGVDKAYHVQVAGFPPPAELRRLIEGIWIAEGRVCAKKVKRLKTQKQSTWLRIVLNEGKNREIRRMLARLDHKVLRLKRLAIGPIKLDKLPGGKSRRLSADEVAQLRLTAEQGRQEDSKEKKPRSPAPKSQDRSHFRNQSNATRRKRKRR